jgi:hypothetical protein
MKKIWILTGLLVSFAHADSSKIELPPQPPEDSTSQAQEAPPQEPISTSVKDPKDKSWLEYDNRIVKIHLRVNVAWTMMELKETSQSGTVSFTLSRDPLITFAVVRDILQGTFDSYVSPAALTPLYPSGFKKSKAEFAGRKSVLVEGKIEDGRQDESYFSTDGHSFYRVSFSAPKESWPVAQKQFDVLKENFRWLH